MMMPVRDTTKNEPMVAAPAYVRIRKTLGMVSSSFVQKNPAIPLSNVFKKLTLHDLPAIAAPLCWATGQPMESDQYY